MRSTYIHDEAVHNLGAPKLLVPVLLNIFNPTSVVDVGCGLGTFLYVFKEFGVKDVLGVDGSWANKSLLGKYLEYSEFLEADFNAPLTLNKRFDIALSLEVAEHLHPKSARTFVESLTNASDTIVFSAAVPFQGGQNHLNEQWPEYWESLFAEFGYTRHDIIRPRIWDNDEILVWYRQNIFVYVKDGVMLLDHLSNFSENVRLIHPDMYHYKAKELKEIMKGQKSLILYLKLMVKSVMLRLGLHR